MNQTAMTTTQSQTPDTIVGAITDELCDVIPRIPQSDDDPGRAPRPLIPAILADRDLPGPLSLKRLTLMGSVSRLDTHSGYWTEHADTLYGRAMIAGRIIPLATVACAFTAMWVWMGGAFPDTLDVMSRSHYRTARHGRRVRVFSRKISDHDMARIGDLRVTRPARTVCDIVTIFGERPDVSELIEPIAGCMDIYGFSPGDCLAILDENPYMSTVPQARTFLRTVSRVYAQRRATDTTDGTYGTHATADGTHVPDATADGTYTAYDPATQSCLSLSTAV